MTTFPSDNDRKKVGWICTYTPEEVIMAAGFTPYRLLPQPGVGNPDDLFPPNICPYVRQIVRGMREGTYPDLEGVVVAHSCNAMMHLYNVLRDEFDGFVYLLDLPRHRGEGALDFFTRELKMLADFLGLEGETVTVESLKEANLVCRKQEEVKGNFLSGKREQIPALILAGGIPPQNMVDLLEETSEYLVLPENCTGLRCLQGELPDLGSRREDESTVSLLQVIARAYLDKPPCPRIFDFQYREEYYRQLLETYNVQGVIYHDLMFCDMCHYDYLILKELLEKEGVPVLQLKTELGAEEIGPLKTRIEAFLELLEEG